MAEESTTVPAPGSRWLHWKGGRYEVVCVAKNEADRNAEDFVIYKSLDRGTIWARAIGNFLSRTDDGKRRFVPISAVPDFGTHPGDREVSICPVCGEQQFQCPSGLVCKNGHGE